MMKQWSNNRERICYEKTSNFNEKKKLSKNLIFKGRCQEAPIKIQ